MEVFDVRRANLLELIESKYEGNRSAFSRASGKNVNLINLSLSTNHEHRRNIGEKLARDIEHACSLPTGWLDTNHASGAPLVALQRVKAPIGRTDMFPDKLYVGAEWMASAVPAEQVHVFHVHDDTMANTIDNGDVALVDVSDKSADNGVYLLDLGGTKAIRRVQRRFDGTFVITPDNRRYEPVYVNTLKVIGRVLSVIKHETV